MFGGAENGRQLAGVVGGRDEQEGLRALGQPEHTREEGPRDAVADGHGSQHGVRTRELLVAQSRGELEHGERVAVGFRDEAVTELRREPGPGVAID